MAPGRHGRATGSPSLVGLAINFAVDFDGDGMIEQAEQQVTPLPGWVLVGNWVSRMAGALLVRRASLPALAAALGVRPLLGRAGSVVLKTGLAVAVLLILYQFFADRRTLRASPVLALQLVIVAAWTASQVELIVRCRDEAIR